LFFGPSKVAEERLLAPDGGLIGRFRFPGSYYW